MSTTIAISSINTPEQNSFLVPNVNHSDNSDAKSTRSEPPAYSEDHNNDETNLTTSVNISLPTTAHLSPNPSSLPNLSRNPSSESLPSYDHVNVDVPPTYPTDNMATLKLNTFDAPYDLVPIEPQKPWPISKKLYIFGYLIWPLWYIGVPFTFFGRDEEAKRWGRRCVFNAFIISIVFGYLIVCYRNSITKN